MDLELADWGIFFLLVPFLLYIDLFYFNKNEDRIIGFRQSLILSAWYIVAGLAFGLLVWYHFGSSKAMDYYTAYVLEKSLSLDNLFVMSVIFSACHIPRQYQHRVLVWGIIGVIVLRGIMIGLGAAAVMKFSWVLYLFAALLIYTGVKLFFIDQDEESDPEKFAQKPLVVFLKKNMRFTTKIHGNRFFVREDRPDKKDPNKINKGVLVATPLFLALVIIEISDVMFAFDSVPAALAVTQDIFIVYTSNIFAILGLRALFFAVENVIDRFELMKYALSAVLVFIGMKVFYNSFVGHSGREIMGMEFTHVTSATSLTITVSALTAGFVFSWLKTKHDEKKSEKSGE